ncbi:hypothetical protein AVEN_87159-1 [Araneus ventricosus]|uniref:Uncharacterized protein n=1 Tax=Araneus ventricosus TaxID=182803 RepID=A0A4Y2H096_ARAVE|nr:hypothetical protein AVEN_87159-1 [Araneus ventricosus]
MPSKTSRPQLPLKKPALLSQKWSTHACPFVWTLAHIADLALRSRSFGLQNKLCLPNMAMKKRREACGYEKKVEAGTRLRGLNLEHELGGERHHPLKKEAGQDLNNGRSVFALCAGWPYPEECFEGSYRIIPAFFFYEREGIISGIVSNISVTECGPERP